MKRDNKNRNSSLSKVEQNMLQFLGVAVKHKIGVRYTFNKGAGRSTFINNEEGC
jgi:hypothetical protein